MSFEFSGFVLRAPRVSPTNAATSAEPVNGVSRGVGPVPPAYDLADQAPDFVEAHADQYRTSVLNASGSFTTEYLIWAANNSQLARIRDPAWWEGQGTGTIPQGALQVVDTSPVFPALLPGEAFPEGLGILSDGADRVIVVDDGHRDISQILALVAVRGDVDNYDDNGWVDDQDFSQGRKGNRPFEVLEIALVDQSPSAGICRLTPAQLATLDGGLSLSRGDRISEVAYLVAPQTFWWTRNDRFESRFGWDAQKQKWLPFKGSTPRLVGTLAFDETYILSPPIKGLPIGSFLSGNPSTPDAYATIRLGSGPGLSGRPAGPEGAFYGVRVRFDKELEGGFDFSKDPLALAVVGATNGRLEFNPAYAQDHVGEQIWYTFRSFEETDTGVVGNLRGSDENPLFIAPIPGPFDRPFISLGSRRPLTPVLVDTEAALSGARPATGEVVVALSTGRLRFNAGDVGKADPASEFFDKQYLGVQVLYDGLALNAEAQPVQAPIQLVDGNGDPATVSFGSDLYIPDGHNLPLEFVDPANLTRGLGVSGVREVPDGTGAVPLLPGVEAGVRPGGDNLADPSTGRIRVLDEGGGDLVLFGRRGAVKELILVDQETNLPSEPFTLPTGRAYAAVAKGLGGSRVVLSRGDRLKFAGEPLYFLQARLTPATRTTKAQIQSRVRDFFKLDGSESLTFAIDGAPYTWTSAALVASLPDRTNFTTDEVAADLDAVITGTGSVSNRGGHLVISAGDIDAGSAEVGFGLGGVKDLSGCAVLGFLPGWRAQGGVINWLVDSGVGFGVFRNPTNQDRSRPLSDYRHTDRFSGEVIQDKVLAIPFMFLEHVPLEDVAGIDEGTFFQITTLLQQGESVEVVQRPLNNWADLRYLFGQKKVAWLAPHHVSNLLTQPTSVLPLGQGSVVPESLLNAPGVGGGLFVAQGGQRYAFQEQEVDYLLPQGGQTGQAVLIERFGSRVRFGARGGHVAGSGDFTEAVVDFEAEGVLPGYLLKVLSGSEGVYRIDAVAGSVLTVHPPFRVDSTRAVPWEIYQGYTSEVYDPALIADVSYEEFRHLSVEPFLVRVLTLAGLVPATGASRLSVDLARAVQRGRPLSMRMGLGHLTGDLSNQRTMVALTQQLLGTLANGVLTLPVVSGSRYTTGAFSIRVGSVKFTPVGVGSFSADPGSGQGVEYLLSPQMSGGVEVAPVGRLKFGSLVLFDLESSEVFYVEDFLPPANVPSGVVEYAPASGALNFNASDTSNLGGQVKAYLVEEMLLEGRLDIAVSPVLGAFTFQEVVRSGQVVEVVYFEAGSDGSRKGDPVTEFLPVFVTDEVAIRTGDHTFTYNTTGRTLFEDVEPSVRAGVLLQNFGTISDYQGTVTGSGSGLLTFNRILPQGTVVKVSYAVLEAAGGERTYNASKRPLYRPPFFIKARTNKFGLRGDRTADFVPGQMLRIGPSNVYIKKVNYFPPRLDEGPPLVPFGPPSIVQAGDITSIVFYPGTTQEVGSRSPGNDAASFITDRPVALTVDPQGLEDDPLTIAGSPRGFWFDIPIDLCPFEPVNAGHSLITFMGALPFAVPGHVLEVGGHPHTIIQAELSEDGGRTRITLSAAFVRGFAVQQNPTVRISTRPVYPPGVRDFIGLGSALLSEPLDLILFGEDQGGVEVPGRVLVRNVDYQIEPDSGLVRFLSPRQGAFGPGQRLSMFFTRVATLRNTLVEGQPLYPRFAADFLYTVNPDASNGLLGAQVTATYTFAYPDTFYSRIVPMAPYMVEVAQQATRDIAARLPAGGTLKTTGGGQENWERGNVGLLAQRRGLKDRDRASRVFLDFYNHAIVAFEQVLETISGGFIGDRHGKFRFFIGRGKEHAPPGFEDEITGDLVPRNLWFEVWAASSSGGDIQLRLTDSILDPTGAGLVAGALTGSFLNTADLSELIALQPALVLNDVDDVLLIGMGRAQTVKTAFPPYFRLTAGGRYQNMGQSHPLSRIFPTRTKAFLITYPGIGSDESSGLPGTYNWRKQVPGRQSDFKASPTSRFASTYRKEIGVLSNPAIGEIPNVQGGALFKRRPRARIWAYSPTGFPELDAAIIAAGGTSFASQPRPALIATPLLLSDFPIDPDTFGPDTVKFLSQGGDLSDLTSGDMEMANPSFAVGDQISWGFTDGSIQGAAFAELIDVQGTPTLTGAFVAEVLVGCVLTFMSADQTPITDPDKLLVSTAPDQGTPAHLYPVGSGDTVFVIAPVGISAAPADPPDQDTISQASRGVDTYRTGFDLTFTSSGQVLDLSLPSARDPFRLPVKEILGQSSPTPLSAIEGDIDFLYADANPLIIPALRGQARDDSGDVQIPYMKSQGTELDRFQEVALTLPDLMEAQDPNLLYVYPDEVTGRDGEISGAFQAGFGNGSYKEPATLMTRSDLTPVDNGSTDLGVGDVGEFDLLLVQVPHGDLPGASTGILSIGAVKTEQTGVAPDQFSSWIEPPRFVTPTTPDPDDGTGTKQTGSPVSYTFVNALVYTNDPLTEPYPADPQAVPPVGLVVVSDTNTGMTTFDLSGIALIALNDGLAAGQGNLNELWSANPADARHYNRITLRLIARTDPNIILTPGGSPIFPVPGEVVQTIHIQGLEVTRIDYLGTVLTFPITNVVFGTATPPLAPPNVLQNQEIQIEAVASWFDFVGGVAPDRAGWYLPHTDTGGVKTSIYGWEFAIDIDTWNFDIPSLPGPSTQGASLTAYVGTDRLSFHEVWDLRHVKARGYVHPLAPINTPLEGRLVVHEVTLGGGVESTVNRGANGFTGPDPNPFTFVARSIVETDLGSYYHSAAGGQWAPADDTGPPVVPEKGRIKVMGWEGDNNTPILSTSEVLFAALPSCPGMVGAVSILNGVGRMESKANTVVDGVASQQASNYDDRITEITGLADTSKVRAGDLCIVRKSSDATHEATTKAGTYLVRHAVTASAGTSDRFRKVSLSAQAGSGNGWAPFTFPRALSYTAGTPSRLRVTDLLSFTGAPLLPGATPSGFPSSGRVFIARNVPGLQSADSATFKEALISATYASIDEGTLEFVDLADWRDALYTPMTESAFAILLNLGAPLEGYPVSGMTQIPMRVTGAGLPSNNCVGWDMGGPDNDPDTSIHGVRWVNLIPPPSLTATALIFSGVDGDPINAAEGQVLRATGTPGTLAVFPGAVENNTAFVDDVEKIVYPNVPQALSLEDLSPAQWASLNNPPASFGAGAPLQTLNCLLPGTGLNLSNPNLGEEGFYAQAGVFLEPSFPRSVWDLAGATPRVVDESRSVNVNDIGSRSLEDFMGGRLDGVGDPALAPNFPEGVTFEVRRLRRFGEAQISVGVGLAPLRLAYEIRRGRLTGYEHNVGGQQYGIVEAESFTMLYGQDYPASPQVGDVWNDGRTYSGTNLGSFLSPGVNINPGDMFRVYGEDGSLIDEVAVAGLVREGGALSPVKLKLARPGLIALDAGDYALSGGLRFEVWLRQAPVPHEQSLEQLANLLTQRVVHQTHADHATGLGGYVPQILLGESFGDVANNLYDDLNVTGGRTFTNLGVRRGDIVLVDPAGTLPQIGGLPTTPEKGVRPFGDFGVADRGVGGVPNTGDHVSGSPNPLDDNRGVYRVLEVVDTPTPHLVVQGAATFAGDGIDDVVFPESAVDRETWGYAIYPTVHGSNLNAAPYVDPPPADNREGQMDLRPTRLRDSVTQSFSEYADPVGDPGQAYSIRPFSYKIIRPVSTFSPGTVDLILTARERMVSWIEALRGLLNGRKHGSYFVFQRDEHIEDTGSPTDPELGLGVFSNILIESLVGRTDVAPFSNTSDCLSILDRRFWIGDRQLDTLTTKNNVAVQKAGPLDTPYTAYTDEGSGGSSVRPVLPDRVEAVLESEDRLRAFRATWLAYRTHRVQGTLAAIERFEAELPGRLSEQLKLLLILSSTGGG